MTTTARNVDAPPERSIVLSRTFDAPRELVFAAFTDREHIGEWWGPSGFTTTTHEIDVRPGGIWRFTMHGPDGTDYANKILYREITPPERLVYLHMGEDEHEDVAFEAVVTFEAQGSKTLLKMSTVFATAEERERVVAEYGAIEGGEQTLERLAQYLSMPAKA